jgi:hypothetical protein
MPTPTANLGRHLVTWPDLGYDPGTGLRDAIHAAIAFVSNNIGRRWSGSQTLAPAASLNLQHNFGLSYDAGQLRVRLFSSGMELTEAQVAASFTIVSTIGSLTTSITVTNTSGSSQTIEVYAEPELTIRKNDLDTDFSARIKEIFTTSHIDATTGTDVTLATASTSFKRLTAGASLISIGGIPAPATSESKILVLTNTSNASVNVLNNSTGASAANRIRTGTGSTLVLQGTASLILVYDVSSSTWRVVGGSGGGGFAVKPLQQLVASGRIAPSTDGFQRIAVEGTSTAVTLANDFMDAVPLDGTTFLLVGNHATNSVTIPFSDTAEGFVGNGDLTLYKGSTALIQYDLAAQRFREISRTIISLP